MKKILPYLLHHPTLSALLLLALAWLIYTFRYLVLVVFLAFILTAFLLPISRFLQKKRLSPLVSTLIIYTLLLLLISLVILPTIPFLTGQVQLLFDNFPAYLVAIDAQFGGPILDQFLNLLPARLAEIGQNLVAAVGSILGWFAALGVIFIISFYLTLDYDNVKKALTRFIPASRELLAEAIEEIEQKLGGWMRGQIIISLIVGLLVFITYTLLGLPFAFPLALIAAILEFIPYLGPVLAVIPALIIAMTISPTMLLAVFIAYTIIQNFESYFLVPRIMHSTVKLHPLAIIMGIIAGGNVGGLVGALLAIPILTTLSIILRFIASRVNH
jgi:predicted PurR-regulated permease PerM